MHDSSPGLPSVARVPGRGAAPWLDDVPRMAVLAAVYCVSGWLGLALAIPPGYATAVWPPSGVALAAIALWHPRVWPGIWVGSLLVNLWVSQQALDAQAGGVGIAIAASIAVGSTLQALLGVFLLERWVGIGRLFERASTIFAFAAITALSCLLASTWGVTSLWLAGLVDTGTYFESWRTWWLGDVVGIIVVTPVLLAWRPLRLQRPARVAEIIVTWTLLALVALAVFVGPLALDGDEYPLAFLSLPCLVWIAYRFDVGHVALATLLLCGIAAFATSQGSGPFVREEATYASLFLLQAFSGLATLTGLTLATAIGAQRTAERSLRASREQLQLFIDHAPAAIAMFDRQMRYIAASRRWLGDHGLEGRDLRGLSHYEVLPGIADRWRASLQRGLDGEVVTASEERFERPDGTAQWLRWEVRPWYADSQPAGIVLLTEDITEHVLAREAIQQLNVELEQRVLERTAQLEELAQRFEALSLTDPLTGLANRRGCERRLDDEIRRASAFRTPLSVLMLDVDHFKAYNDDFGHPAGDEALHQLGMLLRRHARKVDMAARHGGEEFLVMLTDTDRDGALLLAERIRQVVEIESWHHRGVTVSIGVATLARTHEDAASLIADADHALYAAKRCGRNCVVHVDEDGSHWSPDCSSAR